MSNPSAAPSISIRVSKDINIKINFIIKPLTPSKLLVPSLVASLPSMAEPSNILSASAKDSKIINIKPKVIRDPSVEPFIIKPPTLSELPVPLLAASPTTTATILLTPTTKEEF